MVEHGRQAIDCLTANPVQFDLILRDIRTPETDGLEARRIIRSKGYADIPHHRYDRNAMTGDHREQCLEAGMTDYIAQPLKGEVIF